MDVPPAFCQPVQVRPAEARGAGKGDTKAAEARQAAAARFGGTLYYRAGDDLFAFPVAYALAPPELAHLGCVIRSRETAFAFPLSDVTAAMAASGAPPPREKAGGEKAGDDLAIHVTAFHYGPHPDFAGMTRTIAGMRQEDRRQGFLHELERFPAEGGDYLVRISEDRGVLVRLPAAADAEGARALLWFQTPVWSAAVEVPAGAAGRWDTVYAAVDAFVAKHTVKGYFRK